jgi:4-hydroxybutyrate CoA-transferase
MKTNYLINTPLVSAENAVKIIKSGNNIFVHSVAATPHHLTEALAARADDLRDVTLYHMHTEGAAPYCKPAFEASFTVKSFFVGANVRKETQAGLADYVPVFLSEIPQLLRSGVVPIDVALISVSPPDRHGYVSLGPSVDITLAAIRSARYVIAQINKYMPRTFGDASIHIGEISYLVEFDEPLSTVILEPSTDADTKIGHFIAELVEDYATLQMGIGSIPNAVLSNLINHKGLGVHTEMFSDGLIPLIEKGVVTNEHKKVFPNHIIACFAMGTQKVYDFLDDNPRVMMLEASTTNDISIIRKNPKVTAINSAIEIDLTGQVCADSIGTNIFSGVGGQIDFIRGASYSVGGKPIIALNSRTNKGLSKIVPTLKAGAGVVSTRANVHYIVTEYGVANLYGKSLKDRATALIEIAHPDDREMLEKAAFSRWNGHFE